MPVVPKPLETVIGDIRNRTDLWPWYWLSYGEKCYAFATVEAFPANEGDPYPAPGSELRSDADTDSWVGENGTRMLIENRIAEIERQNGDAICSFIAKAHAHLVEPLMEVAHA